jgi:hypothetical protein
MLCRVLTPALSLHAPLQMGGPKQKGITTYSVSSLFALPLLLRAPSAERRTPNAELTYSATQWSPPSAKPRCAVHSLTGPSTVTSASLSSPSTLPCLWALVSFSLMMSCRRLQRENFGVLVEPVAVDARREGERRRPSARIADHLVRLLLSVPFYAPSHCTSSSSFPLPPPPLLHRPSLPPSNEPGYAILNWAIADNHLRNSKAGHIQGKFA